MHNNDYTRMGFSDKKKIAADIVGVRKVVHELCLVKINIVSHLLKE